MYIKDLELEDRVTIRFCLSCKLIDNVRELERLEAGSSMYEILENECNLLRSLIKKFDIYI